MKVQTILGFGFFVFVVGCAPSDRAIQTAIALTRSALPTSPPVPATATSTSTIAPSPTATETPIPPTPTPSMYFLEEFDEELSANWETRFQGPKGYDITKVESKIEDSNLNIKINGKFFYAYYFFNQFSYKDVRLDLRATNQGVNNNSITLICRQDETGWIEFNVMSGGYWDLLIYRTRGADGEYETLTSGGTLELKQGKATNDYGLICNGDTISMFINGVELKGSPLQLEKIPGEPPPTEGQIGFSASSFNVTPVVVLFDWLKISQP
jgi:hypothetical protein